MAQDDAIVTVARDVVQAAIGKAGWAASDSSVGGVPRRTAVALTADADHAAASGRAVSLLTQAYRLTPR